MPYTLSRVGAIGTCGHSHETKAGAFICWYGQADLCSWGIMEVSEFPEVPGARERLKAFGGFVPMNEVLW